MKKVKVLRPFRDINDHETIYKRGKFITISDDARAAALIDAGLCKEILDIPDEIKDLVEDEGHRFVSDAEKATWNAKVASAIPLTWSELKALCVAKGLRAGQCYRITDYVTTTVQADSQSAGHQFDILVIALSEGVLSEEAHAAQHGDDVYFQNAKLEGWKLKYCLDNDTNRFAWADATNGKGVIYGMEDEWGNKCGYDFKNIQFKRYKVTALSKSPTLVGLYAGFRQVTLDNSQGSLYPEGGTVSTEDTAWRYTFDISGNDYSLIARQYGCHGNVIAPYYPEDNGAGKARQFLNNITFGNTSAEAKCWGNKFKERCHSSSFGNGCFANTFGQNCYNNTFGQSCASNTFGQYCHDNTFGQNCYSNTFGQDCYRNTFGQSCYYNTFGQDCRNNTFGQNCYQNTFGQYCYQNTFGQGCYSNTFGQNCQYNTFGQYCLYNTFGQSCRYNTFGQGVYVFCADLPNNIQGFKPLTVSRNNGNYTVQNPSTIQRSVKVYIVEGDNTEVANTTATLAAGGSQSYQGNSEKEPNKAKTYFLWEEGDRKYRQGLYS